MENFIYGAHMSIARGFVKAAEMTHEEYRTNAMQIFLKSPRGRHEKEISESDTAAFRSYCQSHAIRFVVAHCSYLLNFTHDMSKDIWPLDSLVSDLKNIHRLGGIGVVLHIGKYLELEAQAACRYLAVNIAEIMHRTAAENNWVILENTAGQGTEIGWQLAELEKIFKEALQQHPRIRFCFDTAHAFAAGYDLRDAKGVAQVFGEFAARFDLDRLALIHFNDSLKDLGSRVDRHANLGQGKIGKEGMLAVARFAIEHKIPMILETPEDDKGSHLPDLEVLRGWLA
jgi:deoxyribonuclease-4